MQEEYSVDLDVEGKAGQLGVSSKLYRYMKRQMMKYSLNVSAQSMIWRAKFLNIYEVEKRNLHRQETLDVLKDLVIALSFDDPLDRLVGHGTLVPVMKECFSEIPLKKVLLFIGGNVKDEATQKDFFKELLDGGELAAATEFVILYPRVSLLLEQGGVSSKLNTMSGAQDFKSACHRSLLEVKKSGRKDKYRKVRQSQKSAPLNIRRP